MGLPYVGLGHPLPKLSPCGEPFLVGNGETPPVSRVMGASTKLSTRYFPMSTGLTTVDLFNPSVLEQHAGPRTRR